MKLAEKFKINYSLKEARISTCQVEWVMTNHATSLYMTRNQGLERPHLGQGRGGSSSNRTFRVGGNPNTSCHKLEVVKLDHLAQALPGVQKPKAHVEKQKP